MKNSYITKNPDETKLLAHKLAAQLHGGEALCLYGDLGAGKTVFVSGLIQYFLPQKRVLSPTFIIVRHYYPVHQNIKRILHIDLYRMTDINEIKELGIFEFFHKFDTVVAIEWADRLKYLLPKERVDVNIQLLDEDRRDIILENKN